MVTGTLQLLTGAPRAAELARVLDDLVASAREILGERFAGAYLHGSLAQGAADLESDADFLVVTDGPVGGDQFAALARLHHRLAHAPGHWTRHLEGSYAVAGEFAMLTRIGQASWPYVDHGSDTLTWSGHCDTVPARVIMRENGLTLSGPPAQEIAPAVGTELVISDAAQQLREWLPDLGAWSEKNAWSQRYSALNLARMVAAFRTGRILSKPAGARWAAQQWGGRFAGLLEEMTAARGRTAYTAPADPHWIAEQRAFFETVATDLRGEV